MNAKIRMLSALFAENLKEAHHGVASCIAFASFIELTSVDYAIVTLYLRSKSDKRNGKDLFGIGRRHF